MCHAIDILWGKRRRRNPINRPQTMGNVSIYNHKITMSTTWYTVLFRKNMTSWVMKIDNADTCTSDIYVLSLTGVVRYVIAWRKNKMFWQDGYWWYTERCDYILAWLVMTWHDMSKRWRNVPFCTYDLHIRCLVTDWDRGGSRIDLAWGVAQGWPPGQG